MKSTLVIVTILALFVILNWISSNSKQEKRTTGECLGIPNKQEVEDFNMDIIETYTLDKCNSEDTNHQGNCIKCNTENL